MLAARSLRSLAFTTRLVNIAHRQLSPITPYSKRFLTEDTTTQKVAKMTGLTGLMHNRYKVEDMPNLSGKVAVVSGGSAGIGQAVTSGLVQNGCEVHIVASTEEHYKETVDKVSGKTSGANSLIHFHQCDLGNLQQTRDTAQKLASSLSQLDFLFLVAGVGVAPYGKTQDDLANHFQVNHLSQVLITDILLPKLKETSDNASGDDKYNVRIVSESSELHRGAPSDAKFDTLDEVNEDIGPAKLYNRSKLMNVLFIRELAQHHLPPVNSPSPVLAMAVHPGAVATGQQHSAAEAYGVIGQVLEKVASYTFMDPQQGAESALWAGTGPSVIERREEVQGRYFTEADGKVDTETNQAKDAELQKNLWNLSVKTLKEKLGYDVKM